MEGMHEIENHSQELLSILNSIDDPIVSIDHIFQIKRMNVAAKHFTDTPLEAEIYEKPCYSTLYGRQNICPFCPLQKLSSNQKEIDVQSIPPMGVRLQILLKIKEKNESLSLSFLPITKDGSTVGFIEKIVNITKFRDKEEENLRMRNLASLGIMISGVAHELNNPLTGISLTLQNLLKNLNTYKSSDVIERLGIIQRDLNRASNIVLDIISFAKTEKIKFTFSDIKDTIDKARETVERLYPTMCEKVTWEIIHENNNTFFFHPLKIERLFINLFRNSIQALDYRSGKVVVEIRKKKNFCKITVEDNGGGIPEEIIDKIFDPFFTERKNGGGTGLGLSVCHSIIKEHNGKINVKSFNNKTKFIISLPFEEQVK
jgi:signal transduction histidine kinase